MIVCIFTADRHPNWIQTNDPRYVRDSYTFNTSAFEKDNPGINVIAVFADDQNLARKGGTEKAEFEQLCKSYGFETTDYNRKIYNSNGHDIYLRGFLPRNRKYKCLTYDATTGNMMKSTTNWVKRNLI